MKQYALLCLIVVGCGSDSGNGHVNLSANPCATPDSTYYESCVEESGTCGPIPDQVVNISPSGTFTSKANISCAESTQNGCTARDTDCALSSNGVSINETFETTFAEDGSSATSVITMTMNGYGQTCVSTYNCTMTRQ